MSTPVPQDSPKADPSWQDTLWNAIKQSKEVRGTGITKEKFITLLKTDKELRNLFYDVISNEAKAQSPVFSEEKKKEHAKKSDTATKKIAQFVITYMNEHGRSKSR